MMTGFEVGLLCLFSVVVGVIAAAALCAFLDAVYSKRSK
jgi:hypothetical protein